MKVEAQDTIKPKLILSRSEVDICNDNIERNFILGIDIGPISKTDSLFIAEIWLLYKRGKVLIDGYLSINTLFEQFNRAYDYFRPYDAQGTAEYDTVRLEGMNIINAVSGNLRLVNFTGRLIGNLDTIVCSDFIIEDIYLGGDFKIPYIMRYTDSAELCLVNRNLPNRKIDIKGINSEYTIDSLNDTLKLDFFVEASNKKNLNTFNIELNIDSISSENIEITNIYTDNIILEQTKTKCIIKINNIDTVNINTTKILTAEIVRKNEDEANAVIQCEINEINENSCSMNGDVRSIKINLPRFISITEKLNDNFLILENKDNLILRSNDEITFYELIDLYGLKIDYGTKQTKQNEVLFDKTKLISGVYFVRIITSDKINHLQSIKLIIN